MIELARKTRFLAGLLSLCACLAWAESAIGQESSNQPTSLNRQAANLNPNQWLEPEGLTASLRMMGLFAVLSLAPAALLMTTSFVRIVVVLGILRQAMGLQQAPPAQVVTTLSLFMTILITAPVWRQAYDEAVVPYVNKEISFEQAWTTGAAPVRRFMSLQIERTGNSADVWLFLKYVPDAEEPETYDDVPLAALAPAFMLSELKTAFLIGFQICLPFLIIDLVVASVTASMGMLMLPPAAISLPFKLLLFVLVDGWRLVAAALLGSFAPLV